MKGCSVATNYERGRRFEYRTRDALIKRGAVYVVRAAGSHTRADLVALFDPRDTRQPWLVQCKRDGTLPYHERQELTDIAWKTGARPVLAQAGKNGRGMVLTDLETEEQL